MKVESDMKKVVVITGATDGMGRALAKLLAPDYELALCGRSEEKMTSLMKELGDCCVYFECFDVTDEKKRHEFCENVKYEFGKVDVVINSAGANTKKDKVTDINLEDLRYMLELNCVSQVGMIQEFYPMMKKQKSGLFVNILSTCCLFNNPMAGSYTAAKRAMEGISKTLTKELRSENIGVCNVYPGGVDTNFREKARPDYLKPETIAKMIKHCIENEDGCVHDIVVRPFVEENFA